MYHCMLFLLVTDPMWISSIIIEQQELSRKCIIVTISPSSEMLHSVIGHVAYIVMQRQSMALYLTSGGSGCMHKTHTITRPIQSQCHAMCIEDPVIKKKMWPGSAFVLPRVKEAGLYVHDR